MTKLHLSLDTPIGEVTAKVMPLTPFGELARYLFCVAIETYAAVNNKAAAVKVARKHVEQTYQIMNRGYLKKNGCPKGFMIDQQPMKSELLVSKYGSDIRTWYREDIKDDPEITRLEKSLFDKSWNFIFKAQRKELTKSTLNSLEKVAWEISKGLGTIFNEMVRLDGGDEIDKNSIASDIKELKAIVKELTGTAGIKLTNLSTYKNSPKFAKRYVRYNELSKKLQTTFNAILRKECSSGPVTIKKMETILDTQGFSLRYFPSSKSFDGMIGVFNGKMALFTSTGTQLQGLIPPGAKITMNKNYSPDADNTNVLSYVAPNAVGATRVYTVNFKTASDSQKFKDVGNSLKNVSGWIKRWQRDLKSKDPMVFVPATVAYLLYMTGARVGSSTENRSLKGAVQTYGISTLLTKHVKLTAAAITIAYIGKKGVAQKHILQVSSDPYLKICLKHLTALRKNKKPADLLFSFPRPTSRQGVYQDVNPSFFRKYMRGTGMTIKVHGLRHIRGTTLTRDLLESIPFKTPASYTLRQKQVAADKYIKEKILTKVGDLLGHKVTTKTGGVKTQWSTSIKSYVDPSVVKNWYLKQNLEVPKWVPSKVEESD